MKKYYDRLIEPYLKNLMKEFPAIAVYLLGLDERILSGGNGWTSRTERFDAKIKKSCQCTPTNSYTILVPGSRFWLFSYLENNI